MIATMIADLHCHSTASDGTLPPRELLTRARDRGVDMLAITDHDTISGYADIDTPPIELVPGIEFSAQWRGYGIHVVGLGIDLGSPELAAAVEQQDNARKLRAEAIAARLEGLGFDGTLEGACRIAGDAPVGRPHFARQLVESGRVGSVATAFKKYLGPGKPGDVKRHWPGLATVVDWIRAANGIAVLAHPGKYRMTNAKIDALAGEFRECGGHALEVLCGRQTPDLTNKLARICDRQKLHASCGSDFHAPHQPWSELGAFGTLPRNCRPVWELL